MLGDDFFLVTHNEFVCMLAVHTWNVIQIVSFCRCPWILWRGWTLGWRLWLWEETNWRTFLTSTYLKAWRWWTCRRTHCYVTVHCCRWGSWCHLAETLLLKYSEESQNVNIFAFVVSCRWLENVGLEVMATCGSPPKVKGLKVLEVQVFKSCQEGKSPEPEATRPPKLNMRKLTPKAFGSKKKQIKPKLKLNTTKRRPQTKPEKTKKKKTLWSNQ